MAKTAQDTVQDAQQVLVAGGGIGGIAVALALVRRGFKVKVLEQAAQLGEIGAGLQVGPNGFAAFDALGVGEIARSKAVLLGDAAHATLQYLAQGACMAMEDAVTLGEALRLHDNDIARAFALYQRSRAARTARIVLGARDMGRIFHAQGVERLARNDLWKNRTPDRFYDAVEWLYGWKVENCLAA